MNRRTPLGRLRKQYPWGVYPRAKKHVKKREKTFTRYLTKYRKG
uniref:Uncharacterized protein n=1 Tax=uncultured bacterium contig00008 TaxID=1181500 RepID=A0A806KKB2_9BACT|nr:hypothetical protein [uncultured bacterium contig00008]